MSTTSESIKPRLCEVLHAYCKYVIGPTSDDPETEEKTVRNLVINLQRENTPLEDIYGEIERLKPHFGCPLQFYENTVLLFDDAIDTAKKAERTVQREASEASSRVTTELFTNKCKCIELEQQVRNQESQTSELTSPCSKPAAKKHRGINPGDYVEEVSPDLSPGKCSYGGAGFVIATEGVDANKRLFTVHYTECASAGKSKTESMVNYSCLTLKCMPSTGTRAQRERRSPTMAEEQLTAGGNVPPTRQQPKELHAILLQGHGKSKGWRARELVVGKDKRSEKFKRLFHQNVRELKGYLSATPNIQFKRDRKPNGDFKERRGIQPDHIEIPLLCMGRWKESKSEILENTCGVIAKAREQIPTY